MGYIDSKGKIQDLQRLQQSAEFDNIRFTNQRGTIMAPTDMDMFFDYQKRLNIVVDFKLPNKGLEKGQYWTYTNMVDLLQRGGEIDEPNYGAYFMIVEHNTPRDIPLFDASTCVVKHVYYKKKWFPIEPPITLLDALNRIFQKHGLDDELTYYVEPPKISFQEMLKSI